MPNSFTPQTAFEGYVVAKLEAMTDRLNALPCDNQSKRLGKCETDISNIKGKATIIGAISGFLTALFTKYILGK
mgnify:CR=1 FL=1